MMVAAEQYGGAVDPIPRRVHELLEPAPIEGVVVSGPSHGRLLGQRLDGHTL